jgi:hypothetical protein
MQMKLECRKIRILLHIIFERIHNEGDTINFNLLGVLFDKYLNFDDHIQNVCSKKSKSLFCSNRIKLRQTETKDQKDVIFCHDPLAYSLVYEHLQLSVQTQRILIS